MTESNEGCISLYTVENMYCLMSDVGKKPYNQTFAPMLYYCLPVEEQRSDGSKRLDVKYFDTTQNLILNVPSYVTANRISEEEFRKKKVYLGDKDAHIVLRKPLKFRKGLKLVVDYAGTQYGDYYAEMLYRLGQ